MTSYDSTKIPNRWDILTDPMNRDSNEIQLTYYDGDDLAALITVEQNPDNKSEYYLIVQDIDGGDTPMGSILPVESEETYTSMEDLKSQFYEYAKDIH